MGTTRKSPEPKRNSTTRLVQDVLLRSRRPEFKRKLQQVLLELCKIDTTPNPEVSVMRTAEGRCFDILERELSRLEFPGKDIERKPINAAIQGHPSYSLLHFTKTRRSPAGLSPEETYAGRSNLVCVFPGTDRGKGKSVALDAHIDVVAPYIPPKAVNGLVLGRGACDDKGPVVSLLGAFQILGEILQARKLRLNKNVLGFFVIEEETGGNGSLSLAVDRDLRKLYDSVLVCECTNLKVHPANRGAVWYKAELQVPENGAPLELAAFVIEELEKEGASIRSESRHPLFPQRPVQTCHGIIGPFGEHPSRICGHVSFSIQFGNPIGPKTEQLVRDCLESGMTAYIGLYGDKAKVFDPSTGKPMVAKHYSAVRKGRTVVVDVFGATGHMGAIRERDGAITKMAHLVRSLVFSRSKLESCGGTFEMRLADGSCGSALLLEGGQGFVPTHTIQDVMSRMRRAAELGAAHYAARTGLPPCVVRMTYEKLHNVAFDGDPDSGSMRNAIASSKDCGIWTGEPVLGWTVSCDSRLFATEYPGMEVLTFGPGELAHAHSDREQIRMDDVVRAAEFLALFIARQAGLSAIEG